MPKFGLTDELWQSAKKEATNILITRAKARLFTSYTELAQAIQSVEFEAHDQRLFHLLGEISTEEAVAGRGMLSVIVVHQGGDQRPGPGFFELAEELGRDTTDRDTCWIKELELVHSYWQTHT